MKRGIWIGLAAALVFVSILVVRLPAAWLVGFLPKGITCAQLDGTLWNGSCSGLVAQNSRIGDLAWQLRATALLMAKISAHVNLQLPSGNVSADVDGRPGGDIEARSVLADLTIDPATLPQVPSDLRGKAHANLARLRLENGKPSAIEGRIELRDLERLNEEYRAIGDYDITFPAKRAQSRPGEPVGDLDSVGGPWRVAAWLRLTREPGFKIEGTIAPGPGAPIEVVESMGILGQPDAQGRRPFSVEGTF